MDRIAQALFRLFDKHRIVFWYDAKQELWYDFESLQLPGVEKIALTNNEFGVKHRILRDQPEQKFLIYREGPQPDDLDNWLLDVQLGHGEFRTDQVALWLSELELGLEFDDVVVGHAEFYLSIKRKEALKRLLCPDDTHGKIRLKMLAVCVGSEPRMDAVVELLLAEIADDSAQWTENQPGEKFKLIQRCQLDDYLWEQMKRIYGYDSPEQGQPPVRRVFRDPLRPVYRGFGYRAGPGQSGFS